MLTPGCSSFLNTRRRSWPVNLLHGQRSTYPFDNPRPHLPPSSPATSPRSGNSSGGCSVIQSLQNRHLAFSSFRRSSHLGLSTGERWRVNGVGPVRGSRKWLLCLRDWVLSMISRNPLQVSAKHILGTGGRREDISRSTSAGRLARDDLIGLASAS